VVKHNGLGILLAPVSVEDRCAVFCRDRSHGIGSFCVIAAIVNSLLISKLLRPAM
jgi:hypothetical protein